MECQWDHVFNYLRHSKYPEVFTKPQKSNLRKYAKKFSIKDGELFFGRRKAIKERKKAWKLFLEYHSGPMGGHMGTVKTRRAICSRFYWYGMTVEIDKWVAECDKCQHKGKSPAAALPVEKIKVPAVWELLGIDVSGPLPKTPDGYQYILTVTDYFSKHGCPKHILSDQGPEFVTELNNKLFALLGMELSVTAQTQTNDLEEKSNCNITRALMKLVSEKQNHWDTYLEATLFSLRSNVHGTTKHTPFSLMYGREAVFPSAFPVDMMMGEEVSADSVTLNLLLDARETVRSSPLGVINTPMISWSQSTLPPNHARNIHIKLENMQRTGSFKIRGVANQFARRPKGGHFVTMSAGNYGKAFAYASKHYGSKGSVVMPETAPVSRSVLIQSYGVDVKRVPTSCLMSVVKRCVQEDNMTFLHSYDDLDLIAGHASLGLEVLEVVPEPDVVVVCCGGGGLLAGVAAAVKLSGCEKTRIYGVEPEGACTMFKSFIEKRPVDMDTHSIASGLAPPFAGTLPYELCQRYVEGIVLVSDEDIKAAVSTLYKAGMVVEPSGSAAFAAIASNKIPKLEGKDVVCILSGGNIGKDELGNFPD